MVLGGSRWHKYEASEVLKLSTKVKQGMTKLDILIEKTKFGLANTSNFEKTWRN